MGHFRKCVLVISEDMGFWGKAPSLPCILFPFSLLSKPCEDKQLFGMSGPSLFVSLSFSVDSVCYSVATTSHFCLVFIFLHFQERNYTLAFQSNISEISMRKVEKTLRLPGNSYQDWKACVQIHLG